MATVVLNKRPLIITITCIISFILLVGSFMLVSSPMVRSLGTWYPAIFGTLILSKFAACVGTWYMKKWGPVTYMIAFVCTEILYTYLNQVSYPELLFSAAATIIFLSFYKRMDYNL